MEVYYGSTRTVCVIFGMAIKLPNYHRFVKDVVTSFFQIVIISRDWLCFKRQFSVYLIRLLDGMVANLSEYIVSLHLKSPVLAQVYASIGFVSFQKFITGDKVHYRELVRRLNVLDSEARNTYQNVNLHNWDESNFVKTNDGLIMIDYGDVVLTGEQNLSSWLNYHIKSFEKVMLLKNPPD